MLKKRTISVILGLGVVMTGGCEADMAAPANQVIAPTALADLVNEGRVQVTVRGAGMDRISLELRRLDEVVGTVDIPAGTYFIARREAVQNSMATAARTVVITGKGWIFVDVPIAATTLWRARPIAGDTFDIRPEPEDTSLRRLIPVMEGRDTTYAVFQAAVWIAGANASYDELGSVVVGDALNAERVIDEAVAAEALEICERAGIDITRTAAWMDAPVILRGLSGKPAGEWLRRRLDTRLRGGAQAESFGIEGLRASTDTIGVTP
jgi:hypothetical protein